MEVSGRTEKDLINTFTALRIKESPVLIEEIFNFYINSQKAPIDKNFLGSILEILSASNIIYTNDEGFVSLSDNLEESLKVRLDLEEETKTRIKKAKRLLSIFKKLPFIRFIGVYGQSSLGRISKDSKADLIIITESETANLTKFLLTNYLKITGSLKLFKISKIFETDNIEWDSKDPISAIQLLKLTTIFNKDQTYESLIGSNNWIFETFSNYPLEKVSWNFKLSKKSDYKTSWITKALNKIFK